MSITKAHLADSIHDKFGLPKIQSIQAVESILEIIKNALENGEDVLLTRFGKFYVKEKRKRRGRNPATGEDLMLGSRRVVRFKCSSILRDKINRGGKS
jgi:integration host factor subunit alpha